MTNISALVIGVEAAIVLALSTQGEGILAIETVDRGLTKGPLFGR